MLDSDLATAGADFALARVERRARRARSCTSPRPRARGAHRLNFVASAAARAGTSYPRVQVHAGRRSRCALVERHLSVGGADPSSMPRSMSRCAPMHDRPLPPAEFADGASVLRHADGARGERATYRLRSVTLGGLASRSTIFVKLAGRARALRAHRGGDREPAADSRMFAEIDHVAADTVDA